MRMIWQNWRGISGSRAEATRAAAVALVLLLVGCGGGGGGGGTPPPPPPVQPIVASFTPSAAPPAPAITLSGPSTGQQGSITLDVNAQSLPANTYGVLFDLDFNPALVTFAGHQAGTFFEAGGVTAYQAATDPTNSGKLVVSVTLLGANSGVSGSGRIVSLRFNLQNTTGTTNVDFSAQSVGNASGGTVSGVGWAGGRIVLSR